MPLRIVLSIMRQNRLRGKEYRKNGQKSNDDIAPLPGAFGVKIRPVHTSKKPLEPAWLQRFLVRDWGVVFLVTPSGDELILQRFQFLQATSSRQRGLPEIAANASGD